MLLQAKSWECGKRIAIAALMLLSASISSAAPDFEKEVAPILEQNCLFCHNAHESKGDVDLSTLASALEIDEGMRSGDPDTSVLIEMVSGTAPDMPKKADPLTSGQVETLRQWIVAGARWPEGRVLEHDPGQDLDWWSLRPIQQGKVVDLTLSNDSENPVDAFVDAKLGELGMKPGSTADPGTLIRRVTYDLTGLPPTVEEVDSFLAEQDWEAVVDRLLSTPGFGEKFGRHWLDVVRYAESHGYDKDKPRNNAWPYRDYVIESFNQDKPFSRFVEEQVAGDILFPGESDGVVALGFLAAGPWDFIGHWEVGEGKVDGRIAKHLDRDEMVSAIFNTFQSTTVQCAQCHHHKFDPIRMEDYYRLHAVFAAVDRADRVFEGPGAKKVKRRQEITQRLGILKKQQEKLSTELKRRISAETGELDRQITELKEKYGQAGEPHPQYGYHSKITKNPNEKKWVQIDLGKSSAVTAVRIFPAFDLYNDIGAGFGFPVRYRVEVSDDPTFVSGVRLLRDATAKDQPNPKQRAVRIDGDGQPFRFLRVTATRLRERKDDYIFALGEIEMIQGSETRNLALGAIVSAKDSIEAKVRWKRKNLVDGIFYEEISDAAALAELDDLEEKREAIVASIRTDETKARQAEIADERKKLEAERDAIPKGKLVYAAATEFPDGGRFKATGGKLRPIHLLHRGDIKSPGEVMRPGAPALWAGSKPEFFSGSDWSEGEARAELARYLTDPDNPLIWRSIANRLWQWVFGAPLVGTPNDFGRGGMKPTHPELLDFLAASLRDDSEQSMKRLVKMLVMSKTYRRASDHDAENAEIDRGNAYLWRAPRRRLSAEEFRDSLLHVSGVLDFRRGGPSFKDFVIQKPQHSPHYQYHLHDPDDPNSFRRSIYRFVVRSQPQPMLTTLDCADPSISVPERDESTTALQALTQWNNRFVEAMAGRMAARLRSEAPDSAERKVELGCRLSLGRDPSEEEREILTRHLQEHGEASFARVLFNLNAFLYVD